MQIYSLSLPPQENKRDVARKIYHQTPERERKNKKMQLTRILSVPERTLQSWLSRIDKDAKEARDKRIFDLWLGCYTQEEIAKGEGVDKATISRFIDESCILAKMPERNKPAVEHLTDFEPPIYNVWKQQKKKKGSKNLFLLSFDFQPL